MDLDQIEAFLAIVETGGFTRAAHRLHRSQPAISRRMSLLEGEFEAPLFERVSGGIRLTDSGRAFLPHAEAILAALRDGGEAVRDQRREGAGSASLAVVGTLVDRAFASILRRFSDRSGRAPLKVLTTNSGMISRLVRRGEVTLGVRYFLDSDPELACRAIGEEEMVVVGAFDHPPGSRGPRTGGPLAQRWVGFPARPSNADLGRLLRGQLAGAGLADVEIMEVDSLSAQKRLVEAGFGVALLPRNSVREELSAKTLRILSAPRIATRIPVVLVLRRRGYLSPAARELIDVLATVWGQEATRGSRQKKRP
jgi:DNA-binding transcriptional LysR family regulator